MPSSSRRHSYAHDKAESLALGSLLQVHAARPSALRAATRRRAQVVSAHNIDRERVATTPTTPLVSAVDGGGDGGGDDTTARVRRRRSALPSTSSRFLDVHGDGDDLSRLLDEWDGHLRAAGVKDSVLKHNESGLVTLNISDCK